MPPLSRVESPVLAELVRQLRYVPAERLLKQVARVEQLAGEIEAGGQYPADWVAYRVTGYRDTGKEIVSEVLRGSTLLRDLGAVAEHLSAGARQGEEAAREEGALSARELAARWRVSVKTLGRYRRLGLVGRRCVGERGRGVLMFMPGAVERFEKAQKARVLRAGAFERTGPAEREEIVASAERLRRTLGLSLHKAAGVVAKKAGRSVEGVRLVLRREDRARARKGGEAVFGGAGPVSARSRRAIYRAWRLGVDPALAAGRYGCSRAAVRRAAVVERAAVLRSIAERGGLDVPRIAELSAIPLSPLAELAEKHPLLAAEAARSGLGAAGETDLASWIAAARKRASVSPREEAARVMAHHALVAWAGAATRALSRGNPAAARVDEIETALLWAARVKAEVVRSLLATAVETAEGRLGRSMDALPARQAAELAADLVTAAAGAVGHLDPTRGGRAAAPAGLALAPVVARWAKRLEQADSGGRSGAGRATRVMSAGVEIADWTRAVSPWQAWLEPDARVRGVLARLGDADREWLAARRGWDGARPLTLGEACARMGVGRWRGPERDRAALAAALALVRGRTR